MHLFDPDRRGDLSDLVPPKDEKWMEYDRDSDTFSVRIGLTTHELAPRDLQEYITLFAAGLQKRGES